MKILHAGRPSKNVIHLQAIAETFGIDAELVEVSNGEPVIEVAAGEKINAGDGVVLDVQSLSEHADLARRANDTMEWLRRQSCSVLLLLTSADQATQEALRLLTKANVSEVKEEEAAAHVDFPSSGASFSRELSGQRFNRTRKKALGLDFSEQANICRIMTRDSLPGFIRLGGNEDPIFVWSTAEVFDVRRPLAAELEFETTCDEYIPAIIFLRQAFGDRCWHNPGTGAGIVIDDPLLQRNYGFIDFARLLRSARKNRYHITLAFIPWNHWRTRSSETKLFREYSDCFSLCAHGCDHTDNEYGSTDYDLLLRKNLVATERMNQHGRKTGLPTEPVMVCPQEKYSLEAMEAFADSRQFLGLACTACMPRHQASPRVTGADLLLPAQDSLFGFAVFKRHYWGKMSVFAKDLFLGKPAILVEHHRFFKDGPSGTEQFVKNLASIRPDLQWRSLAETMLRTHARRRLSDDSFEVRFFTDRFKFEHQDGSRCQYRFSRFVPETSKVERVIVRDQAVPFEQTESFVSFETNASYRETISIKLEMLPVKPAKPYPNGFKYQSSVALRRRLSEFRDNWLAGTSLAPGAGRIVKRSMDLLNRGRDSAFDHC